MESYGEYSDSFVKDKRTFGGTGLCCYIINGILVYYFIVFTWYNPDQMVLSEKGDYVQMDCWASIQRHKDAKNFIIVQNETFPESMYTSNVTHNFVTWFFWGFIVSVAFAAATLMT